MSPECLFLTKRSSISQGHDWFLDIEDSDPTTPTGSRPASSPRSSTVSSSSGTTLSKAALHRLRQCCPHDDGDISSLQKTIRNSDIEGFVAHVSYIVKNTFVHVREDLSCADELGNISSASAPPELLACEPMEPGEVVGEDVLPDLVAQLESHDVFVHEAHSMRSIAHEATDAALPAESLHSRRTFLHMTQTSLVRSNSAPPRLTNPSQESQTTELDSSLSDSSDESNYGDMIQDDNLQVVIGTTLAPETTENHGFEQLSLSCVSLNELTWLRVAGCQSVGSLEHESGRCTPCLFENKHQHFGKTKCFKGSLCERCHECHKSWHKPMNRKHRTQIRTMYQ